MNEQELIIQAQQGSRDAFAALVEKYRKKMFNLAYSITRNRETADDLTQDTFIKAYIHLNKFKQQSSFGTWLYRIAVNTIKDNFRKEKKSLKADYDDHRISEPLQTDRQIEQEAEQEIARKKGLLRRALKSLPEKHRIILTLRDIQGVPYKEIAEILNISMGTVDSRLFRARKMLKNKIVKSMHQTGGGYEM